MPRRNRSKQRVFIAEGPKLPGQQIVLATRMPRNRKGRRPKRGHVGTATARGAMPPRVVTSKAPTGRSIPSGTVEQVCAVTDPFCKASMGSRWLDEYPVASHTFQIRRVLPINTPASGTQNVVVAVGANSYNYDTATDTAAFGNGCNQALAGAWTTALTNSRGARLVSAGVRWWNALPMSAAGGYIQVATVGPNEWNGNTYATGTLTNYCGDVTQLDIREQFLWTSSPTSPQSRAFLTGSPAALPGNIAGNQEWTHVLIQIVGQASTTNIGFLEIIFNLEFLPIAAATSLAGDMRIDVTHPKPNPKQDMIIAAANQVQRKLPQVTTAMGNVVDKFASVVMHKAGDALLSYMFPFAGAAKGAYNAGRSIMGHTMMIAD
jgi:hypothetical protein